MEHKYLYILWPIREICAHYHSLKNFLATNFPVVFPLSFWPLSHYVWINIDSYLLPSLLASRSNNQVHHLKFCWLVDFLSRLSFKVILEWDYNAVIIYIKVVPAYHVEPSVNHARIFLVLSFGYRKLSMKS